VLTWYDREHHLERLAVPGFRNVRRYHAVEGDPFLFIRYETDAPAVLTSPDYLARVNNPTHWTRQSQPNFLDNIRTVCIRDAWGGWAEGGFTVTARLTGRPGSERTVPTWAMISDPLLGQDGIVGAELWRADLDSSTVPTGEKRLRGREDGYVDWAVVIHATTLEAARAAQSSLEETHLPRLFETRTGVYALAAASAAM
jgi:hypothetical protein